MSRGFWRKCLSFCGTALWPSRFSVPTLLSFCCFSHLIQPPVILLQVVIPYQPPIPTAGCLIYTVNLYYAIFEVKIQVDCFKRRNLPPAFPIINHGIKLSKGFLDASHLVDKSRLHGLGSHQNSAQVPGQHLCIMHQLPQLVIGDIGMI